LENVQNNFFCIFIYFFFATNYIFASEPYTPLKGSPERKAILGALREELKRFPNKEPSGIGFEYKREDVGVAKWFIEEGKEVIFIVNHLKVVDNWAWIETEPRSPDGMNNYKPIEALFHKEKGKWVKKHVKPCCAEWEDYLEENNIKSMEGYYRHLMQMFPGVTRDLFPK